MHDYEFDMTECAAMPVICMECMHMSLINEPINKFYTYTPITSNQLSTHETDMKQNKDQYLHT